VLGAWIKEQRLKRAWTQDELADMLGLAQPHVSRLEKGLAQPTLQLLAALARIFAVPIEEVARLAWPDRIVVFDRLRTEGAVPFDVIEELERQAADILPDDWDWFKSVIERTAEKNRNHAAQRKQRSSTSTEEPRTPPARSQRPPTEREPAAGAQRPDPDIDQLAG
jgi:transcriptional regulator with XRE-family HTH domain